MKQQYFFEPAAKQFLQELQSQPNAFSSIANHKDKNPHHQHVEHHQHKISAQQAADSTANTRCNT
jgi:hypothetical protein